MSLLDVQHLTTEVRLAGRWHPVVSDVSFQLQSGEILALVGESGCGKSTLANSVMKLLPPNARINSGKIALDGKDLLSQNEDGWRSIRGSQLAMIFQDPMTSLDPLFTVGDQLMETVQEHLGLSKADARRRALELFQQVGIPAAEERLTAYPHQFSGGMRQRIALAIAISCHPRVLIADEPTTGLDVSIQAQILSLIKRLLVQERGAGMLLITHDLGVVAQVCDRVAVMYAGDIVEVGDVVSVLTNPLHPYTQALLNSLPTRQTARGRLANIPGFVPGVANRPTGCRFHPRCAFAQERCTVRFPDVVQVSPTQEVACVLYDGQ
jgi:peptide/nickel transport system ATP-binding protein